MESGSHPRLRTSYDRRAMAGEVPWVPGGNPTPREAEEERLVREGIVPDGWVRLPTGAILPAKIAENNFGWGDDRDVINTGRTIITRQAIIDARAAYAAARDAIMADDADMAARMADAIRAADALASAWDAFTDNGRDAR